jgi:hypothetical protein
LELLKSPEERRREQARAKERAEKRCLTAAPWTHDIKWQPELTIKADTYDVRRLLRVKPTSQVDVNLAAPEEMVLSPSGEFAYVDKRLKRGQRLVTLNGRTEGDVMFDGDILIPSLHGKLRYDSSRWDVLPWMSHTPMELMTLRSGTRRAKGHVIIAGLGLGHQLIEVSRRKQVREIVLVEQSQELVDWLLPAIKSHMGGVTLADVVVGDARRVLPKMAADVALVDIFPGYGGNSFTERTPQIKTVWCWGSAQPRASSW